VKLSEQVLADTFFMSDLSEVKRSTLLRKSKGGVVKPEYKQDTANIVARVDQTLSTGVPNFCLYQPQIQKFSFQSPENMAATLIFVIASQRQAWPNITRYFPMLMGHLRQQGKLKPYPDSAEWKSIVYVGGDSINSIWQNRSKIYKDIASMNDPVEIYKYLLTVGGMGLPKAGFATQLILGKFGCIDSINANLFGIPRALMAVGSETNKPGFRAMSAFKDKVTGRLSGKGHEYAEMYLSFIETLKRNSSSSIAQQLWDDWCDIVSRKIWHAGPGSPSVQVVTPKGSVEIPAYKGYPAVNAAKTKLADPESPGVLSKTAGSTIGQQHWSTLGKAMESVESILESGKIKAAAIKLRNGKIYTGSAHFHAIASALSAGEFDGLSEWSDVDKLTSSEYAEFQQQFDPGFLTSENKFVSREEALRIASEQNQLKDGSEATWSCRRAWGELDSADVEHSYAESLISSVVESKGPEFSTLKKNKVKMDPEERDKAIKAGAVWSPGNSKKPVCAIWKSVVNGKTWYGCNTHRLYQVAKTLKGALSLWPNVKASA
jgi:hypothetical protein